MQSAIIIMHCMEHNNLETANFLNWAKKVGMELEVFGSNVSTVSKQNKHSKCLNILKTAQLISSKFRIISIMIPEKLNEAHCQRTSEWIIGTMPYEDKLSVPRRGQFLSAKNSKKPFDLCQAVT